MPNTATSFSSEKPLDLDKPLATLVDQQFQVLRYKYAAGDPLALSIWKDLHNEIGAASYLGNELHVALKAGLQPGGYAGFLECEKDPAGKFVLWLRVEAFPSQHPLASLMGRALETLKYPMGYLNQYGDNGPFCQFFSTGSFLDTVPTKRIYARMNLYEVMAFRDTFVQLTSMYSYIDSMSSADKGQLAPCVGRLFRRFSVFDAGLPMEKLFDPSWRTSVSDMIEKMTQDGQ